MKLLFVRHGKAEEPSFARWPNDADRPLTDRGADRFRRSVKRITRLMPDCDAVFTSPAERAARTAEILSEQAGWPDPSEANELMIGASASSHIEFARGLPRDGNFALVGHDPGISLAVGEIIGATPGSVGLKPGGVALFEVAGQAELIGLLQPKMLARK